MTGHFIPNSRGEIWYHKQWFDPTTGFDEFCWQIWAFVPAGYWHDNFLRFLGLPKMLKNMLLVTKKQEIKPKSMQKVIMSMSPNDLLWPDVNVNVMSMGFWNIVALQPQGPQIKNPWVPKYGGVKPIKNMGYKNMKVLASTNLCVFCARPVWGWSVKTSRFEIHGFFLSMDFFCCQSNFGNTKMASIVSSLDSFVM